MQNFKKAQNELDVTDAKKIGALAGAHSGQHSAGHRRSGLADLGGRVPVSTVDDGQLHQLALL